MGKIQVETCEIEGLKIITPTVFGDERGYFMETYNYNDYKAAGIEMEFVQDYDYVVINDTVPQATQDILDIVHAESMRCSRNKEIKKVFKGEI